MGYKYRRPSIKILGTTIRKNKKGYSFSSKTLLGGRKTYNTATGKTTRTTKTVIPGLSYVTVTGGKDTTTQKNKNKGDWALKMLDVKPDNNTNSNQVVRRDNARNFNLVEWLKLHWPMTGFIISFIGCIYQIDIFAFTILVFGIIWLVQVIKRIIKKVKSRNNGDNGIEHIESSENDSDLGQEETDIPRENEGAKVITDTMLENTEISGIRFSKAEFPFIDDDGRILRYSYYDVEVKGTAYREIDYSKIELNEFLTFEEEPENEYDKNAILVLYKDKPIGYVPKGKLQEMMTDYKDGIKRQVCGFVYTVNEITNKIIMALGFYDTLGPDDKVIEAKLVGVKKKEEYVGSRQDNLAMTSEGTMVDLDYDYMSEKYIVSDSGLELGEIGKTQSEKLQEYEDEGRELIAWVSELDYDDNADITCKIKVYIK